MPPESFRERTNPCGRRLRTTFFESGTEARGVAPPLDMDRNGSGDSDATPSSQRPPGGFGRGSPATRFRETAVVRAATCLWQRGSRANAPQRRAARLAHTGDERLAGDTALASLAALRYAQRNGGGLLLGLSEKVLAALSWLLVNVPPTRRLFRLGPRRTPRR